MTDTHFQKLLATVRALTPDERQALRRELDALSAPAGADAGDAFARKLVELGIGQPRPSGPRSANPQPVRVEGTPLSEQLIRERR
jgi:hypothetical protein